MAYPQNLVNIFCLQICVFCGILLVRVNSRGFEMDGYFPSSAATAKIVWAVWMNYRSALPSNTTQITPRIARWNFPIHSAMRRNGFCLLNNRSFLLCQHLSPHRANLDRLLGFRWNDDRGHRQRTIIEDCRNWSTRPNTIISSLFLLVWIIAF